MPLGCIICYQEWFDAWKGVEALRVGHIFASAWGFRRCSFRLIGQCEGLQTVERATGLAPRFVYMSVFIIMNLRQGSQAGK